MTPGTQANPRADVSHDAVIIVPGIMGSKLCDAKTGETLWGFSEFAKYTRFWVTDSAFERLIPTAGDVTGQVRQVVPCGILRLVPAVAPILQGFEPYDRLVERARAAVAHPDAVHEFGYDWRLSVQYNAKCLARAAYEHLKAWRTHPASAGAPEGGTPRLVIVAHSMGGLLARALAVVEGKEGVPEITPDVRATVTLGTPFLGSVKAAVLLGTGKGSPIPQAHQGRMRKLAVTLPGVYDLLPMYRCVEDRDELRRFTPDDAEAIGASKEFAQAAIEFNASLKDVVLPGHHPLVGTAQPTFQGLHLDNGEFTPLHEEFVWGPADPVKDAAGRFMRRLARGDGTVARASAEMDFPEPATLPQQHGPLARSPEGVNVAIDVIKRRKFGPRQGAGNLGIEVPDVVQPRVHWPIEITGTGGAVSVRVVKVGTSRSTAPRLTVHEGGVTALAEVDAPGVYRVEVEGGGTSAVTQLVLAPDA